ncbi:hypothetical protein [Oricola sp.]|uniref:hypothetical protein n=1 Tax=Oricola sp. TaxID=1979950 RepID=UPI003BACE2E3
MPDTVLVLGSAPNAVTCRDWPKEPFDAIVAVNNAWRVRPDWDFLLYPEDFPQDRRPENPAANQTLVTANAYVPEVNRFGGFVYAGGTMAFTAGYWALAALQPSVLAFLGCDMVYPANGNTHFYGTGQPDPLRGDISLRSLEAKSARLHLHAAAQGCQCVNLSEDPSRLLFPRAGHADLRELADRPPPLDRAQFETARAEEHRLGYFVESGRYWEQEDRFDPGEIDRIDQLWLNAFHRTARAAAA